MTRILLSAAYFFFFVFLISGCQIFKKDAGSKERDTEADTEILQKKSSPTPEEASQVFEEPRPGFAQEPKGTVSG